MALRRQENPFVFGEIVTKDSFVDRTEELGQVVRDVKDRQKLFLLSPRRFGKSSLVVVAFERVKLETVAEGFTGNIEAAARPLQLVDSLGQIICPARPMRPHCLILLC